MGRFVNPDNCAFQTALNSEIYVDKTEMIAYMNRVLNSKQAYICNSRPRRFGKSVTADMLVAYYSRGCDSEKMFAHLSVSKETSFKKYLNKFDVIYFDVQWCSMNVEDVKQTAAYINQNIIKELKEVYPGMVPEDTKTAYEALSYINAAVKKRFVVIIDEWDVLIRDEAAKPEVQQEYVNFLRGMFKGSEPTKYIALAYLTGILPIKKMKTQSALNNFDEYTMLDARGLAKYVGFTEDEVKMLCAQYERDFEKVKQWYDGYELEDYQIYNPRAVVEVMKWNKFQSYWSKTGTYEAIVPLINMDFDGLKTSVVEMLSGSAVAADVHSFQNDTTHFSNKDDVLTYLIHLGYLGYHQEQQTAFIPNEEIRQELTMAVKRKKWDEMLSFWQKSEELLECTLDMEAEAVAEGIERIHEEYTSVIHYHDENSLSSVLTIAYLSSMKYYFKPVRELPTGRGFADFVYIPKPEYRKEYPALLLELKWNKNANTAISQIREKKYPESLRQYTGKVLLVGISYDKKKKKHQCVMEMWRR